MKTSEPNPTKDYKLIPMFEITDKAREIAVAWMECEDKHWIRQKHKLASDIMNYAEEYHKEKLREELIEFHKFYLIKVFGKDDPININVSTLNVDEYLKQKQ